MPECDRGQRMTIAIARRAATKLARDAGISVPVDLEEVLSC
jgi:hypothetical protein